MVPGRLLDSELEDMLIPFRPPMLMWLPPGPEDVFIPPGPPMLMWLPPGPLDIVMPFGPPRFMKFWFEP
jgi:hypothetical protein